MSLEAVEKLVEAWDAFKFEIAWHQQLAEQPRSEPRPLRYDVQKAFYKAIYRAGVEAALRAEGQGERWQCSQCAHVNRMEFTICENCKTRAPVRWLTCLGCGLPEPSCTCHPNPANENTAMGRAAAPSLHKEGPRPIVHYANPCEREDCRAMREELDELCAYNLASQAATIASDPPAALHKEEAGGAPQMANLIGFLKHIIGSCVDYEPHDKIRGELWEAVEMAYVILNSGPAGRAEQATKDGE